MAWRPFILTQSPTDFLSEVSKGNVPGQSAVLVGGANPDISSGVEEDLWPQGGSLIYLSSPETMNIVSANAADNVAGTGAASVFVSGLLAGAIVTDFVSMDGITPVTTTQTFDVVNFMFVLAAGTSLTNLGIITATATIAGTVQCAMAAGTAISQHGFRRIQQGRNAIIKQVEIDGTKLSGGSLPVIDFRIYARFTGATSPWIVIFERKMDTAVSNQLVIPFPCSGVLGALADIRMSASSDQNNTVATMSVSLLEYEV